LKWSNVYGNAVFHPKHVGEIGIKGLVFSKENSPAVARKLLQSAGKGKWATLLTPRSSFFKIFFELLHHKQTKYII
jgi:hypothetical protein